MIPPPRLLEGGRAVELVLGDAPLRFHALWLRDNAQDPATRSPGNGQRLVTLTDLSADTKISAALWDPDGSLRLHFFPEEREISFAADWLLAHAYDRPAPQTPGWTAPRITRWGRGPAPQISDAPYDEVRRDPEALLAWLRSVERFGVARLSGLPCAPGLSLRVAELFGFVRETNYGRTFEVRAAPDPTNLAYTALGLQAHTDNPYRDPAPGLQILACLENEADGGETLLVDGFEVAERLREEAPRAFELLTRCCARFEYSGTPGVRLRSKRPLIELGADGELLAVRFNNRSAAPFTDIPYEVMASYYAAYRRMAELVGEEGAALRFKLEPGQAFVVDNTRVLHGRTAFTGRGGRRLEGCYSDRDGLLSTIAALEG